MRRILHTIVVGVVILTLLAIAAPTFAAQGGTLGSYTLNAAGCYVDISAQVQDAGVYAINLWDDGNFRAGAGAYYEAGSTFTIRFYIGGVILQGAAGIGVYLQEAVGPGAASFFDTDGSAQLWSNQVATDCVNAGFTFSAAALGTDACSNPRPAGSVIYNVPAGALAYSAPDVNSYTGFNLPPGTWYISEFGDEFAKVWIACNASQVWIPIGNVLR